MILFAVSNDYAEDNTYFDDETKALRFAAKQCDQAEPYVQVEERKCPRLSKKLLLSILNQEGWAEEITIIAVFEWNENEGRAVCVYRKGEDEKPYDSSIHTLGFLPPSDMDEDGAEHPALYSSDPLAKTI